MLGAIIGDIVGSRFEFANYKGKDFELFGPGCDYTDDTILTVATADAILNGRSYRDAYVDWGRRYPHPKGAYGATFSAWLMDGGKAPYWSFGNGAGMRVSPVGWAFDKELDVLREAERSAAVSHNHPEGIKGAQAIAVAVSKLRNGETKTGLDRYLGYYYDLEATVDEIREINAFNESCQVTVPQAIICFLESKDFEDAIRNAISIGGDSDTIGAMTGALAEAYYGIPDKIQKIARAYLPDDMLRIVNQFYSKYGK